MKRFCILFFFILISIKSFSITVKTSGVGRYKECRNSFGGFITSCDDEKVQIPQTISEGSVFRAIFLGKNRGHYINFEVAEIKYNSKKGSCRLIYSDGDANISIGVSNCRKY
ncbi:hypothetical protein ACFGYT_00475 [Pasteurella multocida]